MSPSTPQDIPNSSPELAAYLPTASMGAGFCGLGTAIPPKKAGIDSFTIFERASDVGGTWRDNTYPGAACDVPSHAYSLSFEQSPSWSRRFAQSGEIYEYLKSITHKWDLRKHIRFNTEIVDARFDEEAGGWTLTTGDDETFTAPGGQRAFELLEIA